MNQEEQFPVMGQRLVSQIENHPWLSLVAVALMVGAALPGFTQLHKDYTHKSFFYADDPLLMEFNEFEEQYGNDDTIVLAVHSPSGIFDEDSAKLLQELTEKMWLIPDVIRVNTLANYNWVHAQDDDLIVEPFFPDAAKLSPELLAERKKIALAHEVLPDYLVSRDGKTTIAFGYLRPGNEDPPKAQPIVEAASKLQQELQRGDHVIYLSGNQAINHSFERATSEDLVTLLPIMFGLIIFFLFFNLRTISGILLSLAVVLLSVVTTFGISGWAHLPISTATGLLPQILIAVGIADAIHILVVFQQSRREGATQREAARHTLLKNFQPTALTSISTAIGFLSISSSNIKSLAHLGTMAGVGVLLAWVVTYFFLGAVLYIIPLKVKPREEAVRERYTQRATNYTRILQANRTAVLITFSVVAVISVVLAVQANVNSDPYKYFVEGYPARVADEFITKQVGGGRAVEFVIRTGEDDGIKQPEFLKKLDTFQRWIEEKPFVQRTLSIVDIFKATNRSLNGDDQAFYTVPESQAAAAQLLLVYAMGLPAGQDLEDRITENNDALRMTVLWSVTDSQTWNDEVRELGAKAKEMGFDFTITGKGNLYQLMNPYLVSSFIESISIALLLISLLLIIVFRSVKMGLIALIPNCIPLLMGGALFYILDLALDAGSVLVLSVCLGIAVDDTIHILTNYFRLRKQGEHAEQAVVKVLTHTTPALVATTVILVFGFGTLAFGDFVPNVYFGALTALILSMALFTDVTFLPALLLRIKLPGSEQATR